jgi:hypothetical protein
MKPYDRLCLVWYSCRGVGPQVGIGMRNLGHDLLRVAVVDEEVQS